MRSDVSFDLHSLNSHSELITQVLLRYKSTEGDSDLWRISFWSSIHLQWGSALVREL